MTTYKTLDGFDAAGKRLLVRADFNVPMKDGRVADATRIDRTLPTLRELSEKGARVVIVSHLGRPKGQPVPEMSLGPVAEALSAGMGRSVAFGRDCVGESAREVVAAMRDGDISMLENLRFHAAEEKNDPAFAKQLAAHADAYVNDAFSCAHRAHASTEGVARLLPAMAGRLMQEELEALTNALESPEHPVAAVIGGAKISTKLDVLGNLIAKVDRLIIGGGMANTFLNAKGVAVGKSLCEHDLASEARSILASAEKAGCEVILPTDAVVAGELAENVESRTVAIDSVPEDAMILDVGPATVEAIEDVLSDCKTVVWNGPLGAFEVAPFDAGTLEVARHAARRTRDGGLLSVAGGGDTVAALAKAGVGEDFSYVSTAGGAFLEWLEGKELPGVAVLRANA
jgi:phosphoglycerate kinase